MSSSGLFNVGIATIFAREVLEGSIIVINYRSIIFKTDHWSDERKRESLRAVTVASCIATFVAALVVIAVAVPLGILGHNLDDSKVAYVEGSSKLVATLFILQFSLKIPVWLGVYEKVPLCGLKNYIKVHLCGKKEAVIEKEDAQKMDVLSLGEIRFNVMWNLWREVCECGVFLIPFFLGTGSRAIPVSGVIGVVAAVLLATLIYQANQHTTNKTWLVVCMSGLTLLLSVGLLVGAVSEFQEQAQGGKDDFDAHGNFVYQVKNEFWADDRFPMVLLQPFGYSSQRTAVQICIFWLYLIFGLSMHYVMYVRTSNVRAMRREDESSKLSRKTMDEEAQLSSDEDVVESPKGSDARSEQQHEENDASDLPPTTKTEDSC